MSVNCVLGAKGIKETVEQSNVNAVVSFINSCGFSVRPSVIISVLYFLRYNRDSDKVKAKGKVRPRRSHEESGG